MRKHLLLIFILCPLNTILHAGISGEQYLNKIGFKKIQAPVLFMKSTEITNGEYLEFIDWTFKQKGIMAVHPILPDTGVWRSNINFNEPYVKYYFRHPAYRHYPVVGISYYQARAYCEWMADRIRESVQFRESDIDDIIIRLPSEKEWMLAARGGLPSTAIYPWDGEGIRMINGKKKDYGKVRLNVRLDGEWNLIDFNTGGYITTPVESYWPNQLGLFNMAGNVAEWLEEPNKAKGGDWNHMPYNARIDILPISVKDSSSEAFIGFRPLLEIVALKDPLKSKPLKVNAAYIEKLMVKIDDSLYAAKTETTNALYREYMREMNLKMDQTDNDGWLQYTRYTYYLQYSSHSMFANYPAVNISYESAVNFCHWLTLKYKMLPGRKFKNVEFRLPEIHEWELAASGGRMGYPYPWNGPYTRNSRGNYLANYNPMEEQYLYKTSDKNFYYRYPEKDSTISRGVDGAYFTCPVNSYFPNAAGLYQCAGNVAEMTATKGISKGGSWTSVSYYLQISSYQVYESSDANLGFRIFMQVKQ